MLGYGPPYGPVLTFQNNPPKGEIRKNHQRNLRGKRIEKATKYESNNQIDNGA